MVAALTGLTAGAPQPAAPAPEDLKVTGQVVTLRQFPSNYVDPRNVEVWLPPGYERSARARYPVLYVHDGQNVFNPATAYTKVDWGVDEALTRLLAAGRVRPAIVVAIWNTPKRLQEYMPAKPAATPRGQQVLAPMLAQAPPDMRRIISDRYLQFIVEELKPTIDRRFRTRRGRDDTMIMGSSMGALISLYALTEYPRVFGAAACLSTHWSAGNGIVLDYLATALPRAGHHRLYFDFGTAGTDAPYEPFQKRADDLLRAAGYVEGKDWVTRKYEGADHNELAWRARIGTPLTFLLGTGPPDHSAKFLSN